MTEKGKVDFWLEAKGHGSPEKRCLMVKDLKHLKTPRYITDDASTLPSASTRRIFHLTITTVTITANNHNNNLYLENVQVHQRRGLRAQGE